MFNNSTNNVSVSDWDVQVFINPDDCSLDGKTFLTSGIGINGYPTPETSGSQDVYINSYNDEMMKMMLKREKNRQAATKCREKKKEKLNHLLGQADQLEKFNDGLRQECYRLEAEKRYLVKMLMDKAQEGNITSIAVDGTENNFDLITSEIVNGSIVDFNNV